MQFINGHPRKGKVFEGLGKGKGGGKRAPDRYLKSSASTKVREEENCDGIIEYFLSSLTPSYNDVILIWPN